MLDVAGRQTDGQMDGWMVLTLTVKTAMPQSHPGYKSRFYFALYSWQKLPP